MGLPLFDDKVVSQGGWLDAAAQGAEPEEAFRVAEGWWSIHGIDNPTHWQPLPSPPAPSTET